MLAAVRLIQEPDGATSASKAGFEANNAVAWHSGMIFSKRREAAHTFSCLCLAFADLDSGSPFIG